MGRKIRKILIANRGEIACRIIRTCRDMGIRSVAVFSDADEASRHVSLADEALSLGGTTPAESYLRQEKILDAVARSGADAVHPGYGFLSENPGFADAVAHAGVTFIGPAGDAIRRMGDKTAARRLAKESNVPMVPGTLEPLGNEAEAGIIANEVGYPVLLKAAAGGGGKGMRIVAEQGGLASAFRAARSEARGAFGDDRVYIEKYVLHPRHVEVQVLADQHGQFVYLGERECSIQRRHQKVIEETPSTIVTAEMRSAMGESAIRLAKAGGYTNAGTVEFIVDADRNYYFLEMNTRLQVEHPVTEMVTGFDLVREQIRIARGESLAFGQNDIRPRGHAVECRICAEDPWNDFLPSTGRLTTVEFPSGPYVRVDSGIRNGDIVSPYYDPLLAKVITWGEDRPQAVERMLRALDEFLIVGVHTTIPFCRYVLLHSSFVAGKFDTHFVTDTFRREELDPITEPEAEAAAIAAAFIRRQTQTRAKTVFTELPEPSSTLWQKQKREFLR